MLRLAFEERYKKKMVLGQDGNHLVNLIAVLAITFVIFKFISVIYSMTGSVPAVYRLELYDKFILHAEKSTILSRPWTLLTYMFMHDELMPVLGNLLWLWAFGYILQDLMGNGKIIPLFIYGGIVAGIFFSVGYNLFPVLSPKLDYIEGAAPGIIAIAIATTVMSPSYRIFPMLNGGIPIWVLTIAFVIIDFAGMPVNNTLGHITHLAAGLTGYLFVIQMKRGRDWSVWMNNFFDWITNLFNPERKPRKASGTKYFYKVGDTRPFKRVPNITQQRIDALLDKINQKGYRSLTDEEKEILRRASEDDNL